MSPAEPFKLPAAATPRDASRNASASRGKREVICAPSPLFSLCERDEYGLRDGAVKPKRMSCPLAPLEPSRKRPVSASSSARPSRICSSAGGRSSHARPGTYLPARERVMDCLLPPRRADPGERAEDDQQEHQNGGRGVAQAAAAHR